MSRTQLVSLVSSTGLKLIAFAFGTLALACSTSGTLRAEGSPESASGVKLPGGYRAASFTMW